MGALLHCSNSCGVQAGCRGVSKEVREGGTWSAAVQNDCRAGALGYKGMQHQHRGCMKGARGLQGRCARV